MYSIQKENNKIKLFYKDFCIYDRKYCFGDYSSFKTFGEYAEISYYLNNFLQRKEIFLYGKLNTEMFFINDNLTNINTKFYDDNIYIEYRYKDNILIEERWYNLYKNSIKPHRNLYPWIIAYDMKGNIVYYEYAFNGDHTKNSEVRDWIEKNSINPLEMTEDQELLFKLRF